MNWIENLRPENRTTAVLRCPKLAEWRRRVDGADRHEDVRGWMRAMRAWMVWRKTAGLWDLKYIEIRPALYVRLLEFLELSAIMGDSIGLDASIEQPGRAVTFQGIPVWPAFLPADHLPFAEEYGVDEAGLLNKIEKHPDDPTGRSIYAEWLEENRPKAFDSWRAAKMQQEYAEKARDSLVAGFERAFWSKP